jgi:hypothetical protein
MKSRVDWLGVRSSELSSPAACFADDDGTDARQCHLNWLVQLGEGAIEKPVLPAVMVRITGRYCQPSLGLHERDERRPAAAAQIASRIRPAPPQAPVEDRTAVALEKPSETELAMRAKFWQEKREFYEKLAAMSPGQLTEFFAQQLSPLPVPPNLQPQDSESHDWSI